MSITRYGTGSTAGGGQPRPFARAVEADGWLHVSGQVPAVDGEIIVGGIVEQTGYATYFWITALVAIPAVLLFFWIQPRMHLGDGDEPARVAGPPPTG